LLQGLQPASGERPTAAVPPAAKVGRPNSTRVPDNPGCTDELGQLRWGLVSRLAGASGAGLGVHAAAGLVDVLCEAAVDEAAKKSLHLAGSGPGASGYKAPVPLLPGDRLPVPAA
jgi:hypothetical protein